jgi:hypothetical protein
VQSRTNPRYTLWASAFFLWSRKTVAAQHFSQSRNADAPHTFEKSGLDTLLRGTRFRVGETIAVESTHEVRVKDLARRILTFSTSSPGVLGDRVEEMLRDVEKRLLPLSNAGAVHEVVVSTAQMAR